VDNDCDFEIDGSDDDCNDCGDAICDQFESPGSCPNDCGGDDGMPCDDRNACTVNDTYNNKKCIGLPRDCTPDSRIVNCMEDVTCNPFIGCGATDVCAQSSCTGIRMVFRIHPV